MEALLSVYPGGTKGGLRAEKTHSLPHAIDFEGIEHLPSSPRLHPASLERTKCVLVLCCLF